MSVIVLGIDPGLTGAVAVLSLHRGLHLVDDLPTAENGLRTGSLRNWLDAPKLLAMLAEYSRICDFAQHSVYAAIERPIAMPSVPSQTVASQFDTFGVIRAVLAARSIPVTMVEPREWKKLYGLKGGKASKEEARETARRIYPGASALARKRDHNRAEAILIGRWLLRTQFGDERDPDEPAPRELLQFEPEAVAA